MALIIRTGMAADSGPAAIAVAITSKPAKMSPADIPAIATLRSSTCLTDVSMAAILSAVRAAVPIRLLSPEDIMNGVLTRVHDVALASRPDRFACRGVLMSNRSL
jgi:hypothetical protein